MAGRLTCYVPMMALKSSSKPVAGPHAKRPAYIGWAGIIGAIISALLTLSVADRLDRLVFDSWQRMAPRDLSQSDVRIVIIDADSLKELGAWPWPRAYIAALIEHISARGATVIGLDMIFAEADRLNPDNIVALYPEIDTAMAAQLATLPSMDGVLAKTIGRHPVILGRAGVMTGGKNPDDIVLQGLLTGEVERVSAPFDAVLTNLERFDGVALGSGMVNGQPDADGVVRKVPLAVRVGDYALPGFAMEIARNAIAAEPGDIVGDATGKAIGTAIQLAGKDIAVDDLARVQLHFGHVPPDHIISAVDLFRQGLGDDLFAGKAVLVGLAAEGTADIVSTPLVTEGYGVYVQAQATDTLMRGGWLTTPAWGQAAVWLTILLLLSLIFLASYWRSKWLAMAAIMFAIAVPVAAYMAFVTGGLLLNPLPVWIVGSGASLALLGANFSAARRERERLREQIIIDQLSAAAIEGELTAARSIQMGMLPDHKSLGQVDPRMDAAAMLQEAKSVGGDFYDVFRLDDDHIVLVIADVTGKGVPAALFMALAKALTKSVVSRDWRNISECIISLNHQLMDTEKDLLGLTLLLCVLDLRSGEMEMVNAGHENPIIIAPDGSVKTHEMEGGPPLCVVDYPYPMERLRLRPGETLVLITDGVTEAHSPQNTVFGVAGAQATLSRIAPGDAKALVTGLSQAVLAFEDGGEASDDMTILAFGLR